MKPSKSEHSLGFGVVLGLFEGPAVGLSDDVGDELGVSEGEVVEVGAVVVVAFVRRGNTN